MYLHRGKKSLKINMFPIEEFREKKLKWRKVEGMEEYDELENKIRINQAQNLILWKLKGKNQARLFKKKNKVQRKLKSKIEPNYSYLDIKHMRFYE